MRRLLVLVIVLAGSGTGVLVTGQAAASAPPTRTLAVAGTGVGMYPAFDAAIRRYAATTTSATAGTLEVTASTTDPGRRRAGERRTHDDCDDHSSRD